MSDLQGLFNRVVEGLAAQNWQRAWDDDAEQCKYRAPGDLKCAVGHLIPDSAYRPEIEDINKWPVQSVVQDTLGFDPNSAETKLLEGLQTAHDNHPNADDMKRAFRQWAKLYDLTLPPALELRDE